MTLTDPQKIKASRALLGWTQRELAERAGMAHTTINAWETGRSTPIPNNAAAVWLALSRAGIKFTPKGVELDPEIAYDTVQGAQGHALMDEIQKGT
jgi:transcriptional regulator with XRE-family HTH domain